MGANLTSFMRLAFAIGTPQTPASEEAFKDSATEVNGGNEPSITLMSLLRRLHFEAVTMVVAHLKTNVSVDARGRRRPQVATRGVSGKAERAAGEIERFVDPRGAPAILRAHRLGGRDPRQRVHSLDTAQQVHEERCRSSAVAERKTYNTYSRAADPKAFSRRTEDQSRHFE